MQFVSWTSFYDFETRFLFVFLLVLASLPFPSGGREWESDWSEILFLTQLTVSGYMPFFFFFSRRVLAVCLKVKVTN